LTATGTMWSYGGMRTIIAGTRSLTDYKLVEGAVEASGFEVTTVISGAAKGIDRLGERWAEKRSVPVERFPADWDAYGKPAGHIRNREMVEVAEALVAVWDGVSTGTEDCIAQARQRGLKVFVFRVGET
jgi:hypothetical protein